MLAWKEIAPERPAAAAAEPPAGRLVWRELCRPRNLYDELGVPRTATRAEIRRAFRRRALELHPERAAGQTAHDAMARLNEVYRTLGSDERRRAYDRSLG